MPLHFDSIRLTSKFKNEFKINILSTPIKILDKVNDKWELYKFLKENGVLTPNTFNYKTSFKDLDFPILYKPKEGIGGNGIQLINNKKELDEKLKNTPNKNYILQQIIKGYDIDCSVFSNEGKILAFTIQKGLCYSSRPYSPPQVIEF